jgi:hypothetical protein
MFTFTPDAFRTSLSDQGEKVLSMQKKMLEQSSAQAEQVWSSWNKQSAQMWELSRAGMKSGMDTAVAMQEAWLKALRPVESAPKA